jgi:hypothetical protein
MIGDGLAPFRFDTIFHRSPRRRPTNPILVLFVALIVSDLASPGLCLGLLTSPVSNK